MMPANTSVATPLAALLAEQIRARGPMTFADYMDACLYHPHHGYYSRGDVQRLADYYTSVDMHPIFGRLLARQLEEMWRALGSPVQFDVVELGAAVGRLAQQILDFTAEALPDLYAAMRYTTVERSAARRAAQQAALANHTARLVVADDLPPRIDAGCVLSNEFFDALPVHRVARQDAQQGGELRELYVALDGHRFVEQPGPLSSPALAQYFAEQGITLQDGQQAEAGLAAAEWMERIGRALQRGFVLTVDYGHEARELYNQRHMRGTLLAYEGHRAAEDWFRAPGVQDLTAHVNFTALDLSGRKAGLARTGLVSQSRFLMALGRGNEFADLYQPGQSEVDKLKARLKLKSLIFPEGMGETFHVLVQHKGITAPRLTGLEEF
ncbi:MAG TPA: SAM-dependent methyltransferase [Candidatus Acidoferrales bacterium]